MRNYVSDSCNIEGLKELNAEDWMMDLLKKNPGYNYWGNFGMKVY